MNIGNLLQPTKDQRHCAGLMVNFYSLDRHNKKSKLIRIGSEINYLNDVLNLL